MFSGSRLSAAVAVAFLLPVLTQDLQIHPELLLRMAGTSRPFVPPPAGAADHFVETSDGHRIHYRRWAPAGPPATPLRTAILSHGNAGTMDEYVTIPRWLAAQGIAAYVYDYRGYGQSTGWPSERGMYRDAEAVWRASGAVPSSTLVFGHSLGGGPAAYLAEKYHPAVLLLAATFTSLRARAAQHPVFGFLSPFLWTEFPNRDRIARLRDTCLIVVHARDDTVMPFAMSVQLRHAYRGANRALLADPPSAGHAGIIREIPALVQPLLSQCSWRD